MSRKRSREEEEIQDVIPRKRTKRNRPVEPEEIPYSTSDSILVVGECDGTFTTALKYMLEFEDDYSSNGGSDVIASFYEPLWDRDPRTAIARFLDLPRIKETIDVRDPHFMFQVAARKAMIHQWNVNYSRSFQENLDSNRALRFDKEPRWFAFDRVIFCFPRAGPKGTSNEQNRKLIEQFLINVYPGLCPRGEVHIIFHMDQYGVDQYESWEIPSVLDGLNFYHDRSATFPLKMFQKHCYTPRSADGKSWKPFSAQLHVFKKKLSMPDPGNPPCFISSEYIYYPRIELEKVEAAKEAFQSEGCSMWYESKKRSLVVHKKAKGRYELPVRRESPDGLCRLRQPLVYPWAYVMELNFLDKFHASRMH